MSPLSCSCEENKITAFGLANSELYDISSKDNVLSGFIYGVQGSSTAILKLNDQIINLSDGQEMETLWFGRPSKYTIFNTMSDFKLNIYGSTFTSFKYVYVVFSKGDAMISINFGPIISDTDTKLFMRNYKK